MPPTPVQPTTVCNQRYAATVVQVLLASNVLGCKRPALIGLPETMWIGGTASQKDSKHRQLRAAVSDSRIKPSHTVRPRSAALLSSTFCIGGRPVLTAASWKALRYHSSEMKEPKATFHDASCGKANKSGPQKQTH